MSASEFATGRYNDGECSLTCLYRLGRKRVHIVLIGTAGITHRAEPLEEARHITPLQWKHAAYPLARMVKKYRAYGRVAGITEAAKAELDRADAP
jgi:hypothetical protein